MKFKIEVLLLTLALTLFVVSAFFYGYHTGNFSINWAIYTYRGYALAFVGSGSVLMVAASLSYSKRSKNILE